jgi:TPR repeat protein
MGIGCRRDPLEANVWYVKAAASGDERAKQRLAIIQAAASGQPHPLSAAPANLPEKGAKLRKEKGGKDKDSKEKDENCIVM